MLRTHLCDLLGIKTPIVQAPMYGPAGGALAANVSLSGAFGFIGVGYSFYKNLPSEISVAKVLLSQHGKWKEGEILPIGAGFITWELLKSGSKIESSQKWPLLDIALDNKVAAIWFSFGEAGELVDYVRKRSPGTKIFAQVQSADEALKAVNEWKVDIVVAQSSESGGHGAVTCLPTFTLVPQVIAALSHAHRAVPILAAGGVAKGSQIISAIALGAQGVVVGTAFLPCPESLYSQNQKDTIIHTKDGTETVRTNVFDIARNFDWPDEFDGRAVRNQTTKSNPVSSTISPESLTEFRKDYQKAVEEQDVSKIVVWAGQGVGLVTERKTAAEVVEQLTQEALYTLSNLNHLYNSNQ